MPVVHFAIVMASSVDLVLGRKRGMQDIDHIERESERAQRERAERTLLRNTRTSLKAGQTERLHVEVIGQAPVVVLHVALAGRPSPK